MSAPTCSDPRTLPVDQQPDTRRFPSIPPARDLNSALAAINAMRSILDYLLNRLPQNNAPTRANSPGGTVANQKGAVGRYSEVGGSRRMQTVRVYNPKDRTQYVDVEQIMGFSMRDNKTGEIWSWSR